MKTIALVGAGAVGAYFIWGMTEALGDQFCLVAEGDRKKRLERDGVMINGSLYRPIVKTPEEAHGVDYLLIAVKYTALEDSLNMIARIVGEHTTVLSLLNGVDSEEVIGRKIGMEHMVFSFMKIASMNTERKITFDPKITQGVFLGEVGESQPTKRILELTELFDRAHINYQICEDILLAMWQKYAINICRNLPQAVLSVGRGAYDDSEHVAYISSMMRKEVHAVARAKGIPLNDASYMDNLIREKATARYSTLQDLDAHRHTEIDIFSGALTKMGAELGVPTPFNDMCFHLIKALEQKNDGLFDYSDFNP